MEGRHKRIAEIAADRRVRWVGEIEQQQNNVNECHSGKKRPKDKWESRCAVRRRQKTILKQATTPASSFSSSIPDGIQTMHSSAVA